MSDDEFSHHVNQQKNDFAEWIHHTLSDDNFAMKVRAAQKKSDLVMTLNEKLMRQEISAKLKDMRQPAAQTGQPAKPASPEPQPAEIPDANDVDKKLAALDAGTLDTDEPSGLHDLAESKVEDVPETKDSADQKPPVEKPVEKPAEKPIISADKPAKSVASDSKETPEQKKHDPRFFNIKEFIIGLALAFAIGFILCKILFSTIWG